MILMQEISQRLTAKEKTQQKILEIDRSIKKKNLHFLNLISPSVSSALVWADREVKSLSCNEGAAPQSVIINHQGCQAAPRTHLYQPE